MLKPEATLRRRQVKIRCNIGRRRSLCRYLSDANAMPAAIALPQRQGWGFYGYFGGGAILFSASPACPRAE
ncbi:hypothetical protein K6M90_15760 [Rhizobium sp. 9T]|uniref:Uncharacterized protein n=1 Tax=Rhizobium croatiense TaxID=2867516 RepID=A0ABS7LTF1_9HYPH|nr:hypothetical protein [Rhizobium croatiense]MBY4609105.1 hypothetical protein [Rhizobium croatiense]MBY4627837.1 hypothetical protein [Rhizobium croatiense]